MPQTVLPAPAAPTAVHPNRATAPPPPAPAALAPSGGAPGRRLAVGSAQVMLQFQGVMSRFLDTQRAVMLGFLQGVPAVSPSPWR